MQFRNKGKQGPGEQKIAKALRHGTRCAYEKKKEWISYTKDPPSCLWNLTLEQNFARPEPIGSLHPLRGAAMLRAKAGNRCCWQPVKSDIREAEPRYRR